MAEDETERVFKIIPHACMEYITCPISEIPYGWLKHRLSGRSPITITKNGGDTSDDTTNDFNYPIVSAELVPDKTNFLTKSRIRCQIIVPIAEGGGVFEKSIDIDLDLFNSLPTTCIFDSETGQLPSA